jgi:hypothetical protein
MKLTRKLLAIIALSFCFSAIMSAAGTAHAVGVRIDPNGAP